MRLFAALRPSDEFRAALSELQNRLRAAGITGRYTEPFNFHMTLAFIGEWPADVTCFLPKIKHPFSITLSHPGCFPEAKVLWAGTEPSEPLVRLMEQVQQNLAEAGIPFDAKKNIPHITLMRKPSVPAGVILSKIAVPEVSMVVDEIYLYRSDRRENGMEYTVIGSSTADHSESQRDGRQCRIRDEKQ